MSEQNYLEIFLSLPPQYQEDAISESLTRLIVGGEWDLANRIIQLVTHDDKLKGIFRSRIICIGILLAVKARNFELAFERYDILSAMSGKSDIALYRAEAIFHLSDFFLPDNPSKLYIIWRQMLNAGLPVQVQKICGKIGLMLCRQFSRNGDRTGFWKTANAMRENFEPAIFKTFAMKLEKMNDFLA